MLDINVQAMKMFGVQSKEGLPANLNRIFRDKMQIRFQNELAASLEQKFGMVGMVLRSTIPESHLKWL